MLTLFASIEKTIGINLFLYSISSHGLISDSLHCLHSLATVAKGRTHLWQYGSLVSLVQCVIHNQSGQYLSSTVYKGCIFHG